MTTYTCLRGHVTMRTPCWCGAGSKLTIEAKEAARSKYGSRKVTIGNITFDSTLEAARYLQLLELQKLGEISGLVTQHPIAVRGEAGKRVGVYNCDFMYFNHGVQVFEDAKGRCTAVFNLKQKVLSAQGITVRLVMRDAVPVDFLRAAVEIRESGLEQKPKGGRRR